MRSVLLIQWMEFISHGNYLWKQLISLIARFNQFQFNSIASAPCMRHTTIRDFSFTHSPVVFFDNSRKEGDNQRGRRCFISSVPFLLKDGVIISDFLDLKWGI